MDSATSLLVTKPLAVDVNEYLKICDQSGFELIFTIPSYTADYSRRIADLLDLLIQVNKLFSIYLFIRFYYFWSFLIYSFLWVFF